MNAVNFNRSGVPLPSSNANGLSSPLPPQAHATANKVNQVKPNSILWDLGVGLAKSKLFRAVVFTATVVTTVALVSSALAAVAAVLSNPATWIVLVAVAVAALALAILVQLPNHGRQKIAFELSCISRLLKKKNFNEIKFDEDKPDRAALGQIYLGALPNRLKKDGLKLQKEKITAVLSVNEPWERKPIGISLPYTEESWAEVGVNSYKKIDALDHKLLEVDVLHEAADYIHARLVAGENVYVHCRAGQGRSAMAIAAYLIKYRNMSVKEAGDVIKASRPISTIQRKTTALDTFKAGIST